MAVALAEASKGISNTTADQRADSTSFACPLYYAGFHFNSQMGPV